MIGHVLNEIYEKSHDCELLEKLKKEEAKRRFYIIRFGKTEIKTTSSQRLKDYMNLFPMAKITIISNGE